MQLERPPHWLDLLTDHENLKRITALVMGSGPLFTGYRPWRKVSPIARDLGISPEIAWAATKLHRSAYSRPLPLSRGEGGLFVYTESPLIREPLHRIDRAVGGGGSATLHPKRGLLGAEHHRTRLHIRSLMDEAAESSLIEGAATTRKEAIELLKSERPPKTVGERMVVNNYVAMQKVKQILGKELSVEMLTDLQRILTEQTLANPKEAGRLRRADERVQVVSADNTVIHVPPPAAALPERLQALCRFANAKHEAEHFLHPIIKASILHFMIGYEHPFCDGNGRTARAIFYWFALRHGYDIFEFVSISEIIRKGYARYPQAFVDVETDDGDLTYFVLYHLDVIERALDRLAEHLEREEAKIERSERLLRIAKGLNLRQRHLLEHALRHPTTEYTAKSHRNSNGIALGTARADLDDLVRRKLMTTSKRVREVIYHVSPTLKDRLARKGL